jgi:hypothetical protein
MVKQGQVAEQHQSEIDKINEQHEVDKQNNSKENDKVIVQHDKEKQKELQKDIEKAMSENEKKIKMELSEHTKQVNSLQQKLSASELKTRTLESQNKSLQETQKQLDVKVATMD